jgi:hypothetical protein
VVEGGVTTRPCDVIQVVDVYSSSFRVKSESRPAGFCSTVSDQIISKNESHPPTKMLLLKFVLSSRRHQTNEALPVGSLVRGLSSLLHRQYIAIRRRRR